MMTTDRPTVRQAISTLMLAALLVCAGGPAASAQDVAASNRVAARQAYDLAEGWMRQLRVAEFVLPIEIEGLAAVHVTIRKGGPTLGQATAAVADPAALDDNGKPGKPKRVDLMPLLQQATREAIKAAAVTLKAPNALVEEREKLLLDVQFAVNLKQVRAKNLRDLPSLITLDADGLSMRRATEWAWSLPSNNISTNANLLSQINRLLGELHYPLDKLQEVGQQDGPELYRCDVIHIVRPALDAEPVFLHRGNELLPTQPIMDKPLDALLVQLSGHLIHRQRQDGLFAGTYQPTSDIYEPAISAAPEMAVAAFALARTARLSRLDLEQRTLAQDAARKAVKALLDAQILKADDGAAIIKGPAVADLKMTALLLLSLMETPNTGDLKNDRLRLGTALSGMFNEETGWFADNNVKGAREATPIDQALGAAALARLFDQTREPAAARQAVAALDSLWKRVEKLGKEQSLDSTVDHLMPWLSYAETDLERLGQNRAERIEFLIGWGERMWKNQVQPLEGAQPDAVGGYLTTNGLFEEPTWQSAVTLAGQSVVLRHANAMAENDRIRWIVNAGMAARFIKQLTMQPSGAFYVRNPAEAIGGVRVSLWDNRQPLYTTSMALLSLAELKHTLAAMGGGGG
ncbi:MAG: hypothetical protein GC159_11985 [Phycisphaera sp.]|nr:hypothetical protein [Phycisphaera sp.]